MPKRAATVPATGITLDPAGPVPLHRQLYERPGPALCTLCCVLLQERGAWQVVDAAVAHANTVGNQVLGQTDGPLKRAVYNPSSGETENRGGESTLGNLVADHTFSVQEVEQPPSKNIARAYRLGPGGMEHLAFDPLTVWTTVLGVVLLGRWLAARRATR